MRNGIYLLAAAIPYIAALWIYVSRLGMGRNIIWYQVLALSTGMFFTAGFFLWAAAIALGIRFLAIQFQESTIQPDIPKERP